MDEVQAALQRVTDRLNGRKVSPPVTKVEVAADWYALHLCDQVDAYMDAVAKTLDGIARGESPAKADANGSSWFRTRLKDTALWKVLQK